MTWPNGAGVSTNQWGPWEPVPSVGPPPPAENVAQTNPSAPSSDPSGMLITQYYLSEVLAIDEAQQGAVVSNVAVRLAGVDPAQIAQNNWYAGNPASSSTG